MAFRIHPKYTAFLYAATNGLIGMSKEKSDADQKIKKSWEKEISEDENFVDHRSKSDNTGMIEKDAAKYSGDLLYALMIRSKYMFYSNQSFPMLPARFLEKHLDDHHAEYVKNEFGDSLRGFTEKRKKREDHTKSDSVKSFKMHKGIMYLKDRFGKALEYPYEDFGTFINFFNIIRDKADRPDITSFCNKRLNLLSLRYDLHELHNDKEETKLQIKVKKDFNTLSKIDTHIHSGKSMTQHHLLNFIKTKLEKEIKRVTPVIVFREQTKEGVKELTLKQVFEEINIKDPAQVTLEKMNVHFNKDVFGNFRYFDKKGKIFGSDKLKRIFLKWNNDIDGEYFADLIHEVVKERSGNDQYLELRISIQGSSIKEWDMLAKWLKCNRLLNLPEVRWIIQIPRIYKSTKNKLEEEEMKRLEEKMKKFEEEQMKRLEEKMKKFEEEEMKTKPTESEKKKMDALTKTEEERIDNFQDYLQNIFLPLFEATKDKTAHPELYEFLTHVSAIDSVGDESRPELMYLTEDTESPDKWTDNNPPYVYYLFYMFANISVLNQYRREKDLNTFKLRTHCGEAGDPMHLVAGFMLADGIAHGINLEKNPVLQYLYYLAQIGIDMSPLSNNALFSKYYGNPFPMFFKRGLHVSLSSDDPLIFHRSKDPLEEEYLMAAHIWSLSETDLCEIRRNGFFHSGLIDEEKTNILGEDYQEEGYRYRSTKIDKVNNIELTNVPTVRIMMRHDTWRYELSTLCHFEKYPKPLKLETPNDNWKYEELFFLSYM